MVAAANGSNRSTAVTAVAVTASSELLLLLLLLLLLPVDTIWRSCCCRIARQLLLLPFCRLAATRASQSRDDFMLDIAVVVPVVMEADEELHFVSKIHCPGYFIRVSFAIIFPLVHGPFINHERVRHASLWTPALFFALGCCCCTTLLGSFLKAPQQLQTAA
jgi:hypothetical protein